MKRILTVAASIGLTMVLVPILIMSFSFNVLLGTIVSGLILLGLSLGIYEYFEGQIKKRSKDGENNDIFY